MSGIVKKDPLAALLQAAAKLPAETGHVAHYARRLGSAGSSQVVLADVSSSMAEPAGARTKIEVLREALLAAPPARIIAFSSTPREISSASALPEPSGGTALHLALELAGTMNPARTLVISDGLPDSESLALAAAAELPGTIDVIFCGPDSDFAARDFMMRLARAGGGRYAARDIRLGPVELGSTVCAMLTRGKP